MSQVNLEIGRILIVDDNPNNLKVLSGVLRSTGWEILVATDGEGAIEQAEYSQPDIMLLDVMMPGMDGFETCQRLKTQRGIADIPVIFMTSLSDTVDKVKGFSVGAVDYITKPFEQEEVVARVRAHLKIRNLTKQVQVQNEQLQTLTQTLEQRVVTRTSELSNALSELQQAQAQLLQREAKLEYDAFHDSLTGLPNRAWLMNQLQYLTRLTSHNEDFHYAVLFADLDHFKVVNDSLGHLAGDQLLKGVAQRLQVLFTQKATVARFGGDEFVILVEDIEGVKEAIGLAVYIQEQLKLPFKLDTHEVFVGVSVGITLSSRDYAHPEDALRDADAALYQAKKQGRGCYALFNPAIRNLAITRMQLEGDLRKAVANLERPIAPPEFCLHYQPIVSLATGRIAGFEALLRWSHASGQTIPPNQFISIAEETGLINPLGSWVLREACQQMHQWHQQFASNPGWTINVNVSPIQLRQANLAQQIADTLEETGLATHHLKLELTESCLLETNGFEAATLEQLEVLGIKLCIDDFGTGYSSLSRLHDLPIATLKIDYSFVSRIDSERDSIEVIQAIVALAQSLGMDTVAEGIEILTQQAKLGDMGCEFGQGYLFSRPLSSLVATQLLCQEVQALCLGTGR